MADPGVDCDELDAAYRYCRAVTADHGRTYFLASRLLPASRRTAVHALYGFARMVDDVVDVETTLSPAGRTAAVDAIEAQLRSALDGRLTADGDARRVVLALVDTIARFDIPTRYFWAFLDAMRMDIPGTDAYRPHYRDMSQLRQYMYGSASVIGLQLLPVLGAAPSVETAAPSAVALGEAFQMTNFIRDVGEDLDRGRMYLPSDEWAAFGVDLDLLHHGRRTGTVDRRVRRALAHFVALTRALYRVAEPGLQLLDVRVRPGIRTAFILYSEILDEVERNAFRVLDRRATVPRRRRVAVALPHLARACVLR